MTVMQPYENTNYDRPHKRYPLIKDGAFDMQLLQGGETCTSKGVGLW